MKSQQVLKRAYKEAEQYFKDNRDEFKVTTERKRYLLDDDCKIQDASGKKFKRELSPKQAEIVRKIYNRKLRRMRKDILHEDDERACAFLA
jgi:hypothetical protein